MKDDYIASWFSYEPVSRPAPKPTARAARCAQGARPRPRGVDRAQRCGFAIVGTRGIPARYGGFETFAEELSTRLAARGHQVTVYCRERHPEPTYRGVRLKYLPTSATSISTRSSTRFFPRCICCRTAQDAALYCNAANAIFTWMPRVAGHSGGAERGRPGAQSQEVEPAGEGLVSDVGVAGDVDARTRWSPTRASIADYYRERYANAHPS